MSDANPQQEPSMEEILASIRRIISEDEQPGEHAEAEPAESDPAEAEPEAAAPEEPEPEPEENVLELTEVAEEEDGEEEPSPEAGEPEDESEESEELSIDDVLNEVEVPDEIELRDEETPAEPPPEPAEAVAPPVQPEESSLLANQTSMAAGGMLGSLVAAVDRAHGGSTLGDGNRTIEDLVKEVMRPMVKEWLDENLPDLTERLVRREIERLARRAEDD